MLTCSTSVNFWLGIDIQIAYLDGVQSLIRPPIMIKVKDGHTPMERRRGASLPFIGR